MNLTTKQYHSSEESLITAAMEYVKKIFQDDSSGHDYYHTLRVYRNGMLIAKEEQGDTLLVGLATLLHDVDDIKLFPKQKGELLHCKEFLRQHSVSDAITAKICQAIEELSFKGKDTKTPSTLEGKIVQDADRLDAIGAIGIARTFTFGGHHHRELYNPEVEPRLDMTEEEYRANRSSTIHHFYEKLLLLKDLMNTSTGKRLAESRHEFMLQYLEQFHQEWDGLQ